MYEKCWLNNLSEIITQKNEDTTMWYYKSFIRKFFHRYLKLKVNILKKHKFKLIFVDTKLLKWEIEL